MSEMQTARSSLNGWGTDQAPQNDQLMSENRVLCLKSALRLEWRGQNGQDEAEQSVHGLQMLGDSFGQSMRIRFSVHTGGDRADFRAALAGRFADRVGQCA